MTFWTWIDQAVLDPDDFVGVKTHFHVPEVERLTNQEPTNEDTQPPTATPNRLSNSQCFQRPTGRNGRLICLLFVARFEACFFHVELWKLYPKPTMKSCQPWDSQKWKSHGHPITIEMMIIKACKQWHKLPCFKQAEVEDSDMLEGTHPLLLGGLRDPNANKSITKWRPQCSLSFASNANRWDTRKGWIKIDRNLQILCPITCY